MNSPKISAIILAMNEADRILPCLESLSGWVDQIVVLDSGSSDETVSLCRERGAEVHQTDWPGEGIQRQRSIDHAGGEWLLWIDADERVSEDLRDEIIEVINNNDKAETGYMIRWTTQYFGKPCIHGGLGDAHCRLFKRAAASFNPETLVHPQVDLNPNQIGELSGRLIHHSFRDFPHLLSKMSDYALRSATEKIERHRASGPLSASGHAAWRFFQLYILRMGLLDGSRGFFNAALAAQYVFNKYAAVWAHTAARHDQ